jgi:hypothetical protein
MMVVSRIVGRGNRCSGSWQYQLAVNPLEINKEQLFSHRGTESTEYEPNPQNPVNPVRKY